MPADPPRLNAGEARVAYACPDHPDELAIEKGRCPIDGKPRDAQGSRRLSAAAPVVPDASQRHGRSAWLGLWRMRRHGFEATVISYSPAGQVLSVPRSAVIDAGERKVVFVETMPGMFDGVEVVLGPRCGDDYPVVRGLEAGQRVAFAGAFLLDAETRSEPRLAAGYFGAGRGERKAVTGVVANATTTASAGKFPDLAPEDRTLAERQKVCPVTNKPLGSMGTPARVVLEGQSFSCAATDAKAPSSENRSSTWPSSGAINHCGTGRCPCHNRNL